MKADARVRMFVAVYPAREVAQALLRELGSLELPPHRQTPAPDVHLTLHFIGAVEVARVEATVESARHAAHGIGPFELRAERMIALPERGHARLVAAALSRPPEVMELHRRLVSRLASKPTRTGGRLTDDYLPHMTLCRFKRPGRIDRVGLPAVEGTAFPVAEVRVMKSVLRPEGPEYTIMAIMRLGE